MKKSFLKVLAIIISTVMLFSMAQIVTAADIPAIPFPSATNEVIESYDGLLNSVTVPAGKNMYYDGYRMLQKLPYVFKKLLEVNYIELDVYVSAETANRSFGFWVTNKSDAASVRGRAYFPALKSGWNHVAIPVSSLQGNNGFKFNSYDEWNSIYFEGKPNSNTDVTIAYGNIALTKESPEKAPNPSYIYDVVSTRNIDLKGTKNNTTDERFFKWETYQSAFNDTINNPLDITAGDYLEFDYYSDVDATFRITMGSLHKANGFQFYDNRSKYKSVTVAKGWNHIVLSTDGAFREVDTSTLKSYNPKEVTGFVLRNVTSSYIRLTNVAVTQTAPIVDPKLTSRKDFDFGAAFHAPAWGPAYNARNLEQQIEQLAEMGGTLYRVDAKENYDHLDKTVKLCNAYGIKVMLIVYIPGRTFDPTKTVDLKAIEDRYKYYASRYDGNHGHGKIDYIQIDNELDVKLCSYSGGTGNFKNISDYPEESLETISEQVKAAISGVKSTGADIKTIINISWVHYGILKYFYQDGADWDITGHDWYTDMLTYGGNSEEYYGAGQELYDLFKKPIIICETNMQMNKYNGSTVYPEYTQASWWNPLVEMLKDYYAKDYVIGCVLYEFYDELVHQSGTSWGGEAHFGIMETNSDGTFKQAKPIYTRCKDMFGGKDLERLDWNTVNKEYTVYADYDMVDLIRTKNILLNGNGYNSRIDEDLNQTIDPMDYVNIKKKLFAEF